MCDRKRAFRLQTNIERSQENSRTEISQNHNRPNFDVKKDEHKSVWQFPRQPSPSFSRFKGEDVDPNQPVLYAPIELAYIDVEALIAYARTLKRSN